MQIATMTTFPGPCRNVALLPDRGFMKQTKQRIQFSDMESAVCPLEHLTFSLVNFMLLSAHLSVSPEVFVLLQQLLIAENIWRAENKRHESNHINSSQTRILITCIQQPGELDK